MPLINCDKELESKWKIFFAMIEEKDNVIGAVLIFTSTKLHVPVVTLSINGNIKFLENIKQGFKRTFSWNKYRSEIKVLPNNNKWGYLVDPTLRNINRFFVLSLKKWWRWYFYEFFFLRYNMPVVEITDFNVLIDNKPLFAQPVKNKQEAYENLIQISRNHDYTAVHLLDFSYHQNSYKLIGNDLSRQANTSIPQQINFLGKLEEDNGAAMFFLCAEKQQKTILIFSIH